MRTFIAAILMMASFMFSTATEADAANKEATDLWVIHSGVTQDGYRSHGYLTDSKHNPLPCRLIKLQRYTGDRWIVVKKFTTDNNGQIQFFTPFGPYTYRLRFRAGDGIYKPSSSDPFPASAS